MPSRGLEVYIRETTGDDIDDVLDVERTAFGRDDEAKLVNELLVDPTARPLLSLLAFKTNRPVGHILFTRVHVADTRDTHSAMILAPLAVVPDTQGQRIGAALIEKGLELLAERDVDLVFVLGYPEYYTRHGFTPARKLGFNAPYPIPDEYADAWMVNFLRTGLPDTLTGTVICSKVLSKPEYWRE